MFLESHADLVTKAIKRSQLNAIFEFGLFLYSYFFICRDEIKGSMVFVLWSPMVGHLKLGRVLRKPSVKGLVLGVYLR